MTTDQARDRVDRDFRYYRSQLIAHMDALSRNLATEATQMRETPEYIPNSLGVVQNQGQIIDRLCHVLDGIMNQFKIVNLISRERSEVR